MEQPDENVYRHHLSPGDRSLSPRG